MKKSKRKPKAKSPPPPPPPKLIPAVAYLRRSTSGKGKDGKERQEKSISQQRKEIEEQIRGKYEITEDGWYIDDGKTGTTLDRKGFQQMLARAKDRRDFECIVCDHTDRIARAGFDDVYPVVIALKAAGVRSIHSNAQGFFDLGKSSHDIGEALKLLIAILGAHEYSRQLSRRVALAMRNRALEGKRAGAAPYGYAHAIINGKGGLKLGKLKEQRIVKWVYDQFAVKKKSINWITGELNRQKIPSGRGGKWWVAAVSDMLRNPVYCGHLVFNQKKSGKFFFIDDSGEVVETDKRKVSKYRNTPNGLIVHKNVYPALIPQQLFDKAQKRLAGFTADKTHRPRGNGYALTGILRCGKCGAKLFGCAPSDKDPKTGKQVPRGYKTYRCSANRAKGQGACPGKLEIHEEVILPRVIKELREEIMEITSAMVNPPDESTVRRAGQDEDKQELQEERDALAKKISVAGERYLEIEDKELRQEMNRKVNEWRQQLVEMEARLLKEPETLDGYPFVELKNLREYWAGVEMLFSEGKKGRIKMPPTPEDILRVDPNLIREMLRELGVQVTIHWETRQVPIMNGPRKGQLHKRHFVTKGHLQGGKFGEKGCYFPLSSVCRTLLPNEVELKEPSCPVHAIGQLP